MLLSSLSLARSSQPANQNNAGGIPSYLVWGKSNRIFREGREERRKEADYGRLQKLHFSCSESPESALELNFGLF